MGENGGVTENKWNWKTAVCVSGLQFGRVRTGVIGAMACNMLHGRPCDSYIMLHVHRNHKAY